MSEVADRKSLMGIRLHLDSKKVPRNFETEVRDELVVRSSIKGDEMEVTLNARVGSFEDKERMKVILVQEAKKLVDKYGADQ